MAQSLSEKYRLILRILLARAVKGHLCIGIVGCFWRYIDHDL